MKSKLAIAKLKKAAKEFCKSESKHRNKDLFGVTDVAYLNDKNIPADDLTFMS